MTIDEVIAYFGSMRKACMALEIKQQNAPAWKIRGYIPWKQQFKLSLLSEGKLVPDSVDPIIAFQAKRRMKR